MSTPSTPVHLAVDLGASSGRVLAGKVTDSAIELEEVHRFANGGVNLGKRLVWNLLGQWEQIQNGLASAAATYGSSVKSVGADTWGVDYVLLDKNDDQVGPCFTYRDARTQGQMAKAFERISRAEIFAETGLQFMEINTAYQLFAMRQEQSPLLEIAKQFLMVPDYLHWQLSGEKVNEFTNASTTQLLNPTTGNWSDRVLNALDIPSDIFSAPTQPGISLGKPTSEVVNRTNLNADCDIILPATHDTGSAVLAVPANSFASEKPDWCYISCGTWSLMGAELASPNLSETCQEYNFTNEGGVNGSVRLLKNISGLWIVQQCRTHWQRAGKELSWSRLVELAEAAPSMVSVIDPDHASFVAPPNMPEAIQEFCKQTGQPVPQTEGEVIRCALESLALRYRQVLEMLEKLVGRTLETIHIVGGGVQNKMLCQLAADACQRQVVAGPVEATALGNVMMQAIGTGVLGSIEEARNLIRNASDIETYAPRPHGRWDEGADKLRSFNQ